MHYENMPLAAMGEFLDRARADLLSVADITEPKVFSILEDLIIVVGGLVDRQLTNENDRP